MANSLIGDSAVATHLYQAFYGQAPSNALYTAYINTIAANGQAAFAASIASNFNNVGNAALALQVLNNLGVTATTVTATGEYAKLLAALTDAFAAYPTMRGQVILNATNLFANLEGDATYGTAAATYNNQSLANFTYANNAANTAPGTVDITVGTTYTLTTGVDTLTGTGYNDTFNAIIDNTTSAVTSTWTGLDSLAGGAGSDTLNLNVINGAGGAGTAVTSLPTISATGIETLNIRSAVGLTADLSAYTDFTAINDTLGTAVALTASSKAAVTVSGATTSVAIDGGTTQTVTSKGAVTLGATTGATGAINVTDTAQGANNIAIDGGTSVSATVTEATTGANTVTVGATTKPTGAVTIADTEGPAASGTFAGGAITVNGGTTVSVTVAGAQPVLATAGSNAVTTQSAVTVNGSAATTAVTVTQAAAVAAANTVLAVTAAKEVDSIAFSTLAASATATVYGLSFTNTGATTLTVAQVAAAFANLANGATQGASVLGTYSGSLTTGWTSGAVTGASTDTVAFTAKTAATANVATLSATGGTVTLATAGVAAVSAAGAGGIANGVVNITDVNYLTPATAGTITSVTESGYDSGYVKSNALTSLSLANSQAGVTEKGSVAFAVALTAGQTVSLGGLTYTSTGATTAAQLATAFASLSNGAITGGGTGTGTYSGTLSGWSTGAVATGTVVFTSSTATTNVTDLAATGTGTLPAITPTQGYADTVSVYNNTATTLGLTVNKLAAGSLLNLDTAAAKYTTLNITTATADSTLNITGAAVTALTVAGTNAIDLTGSTFTALGTMTVSGAAGVKTGSLATLASLTDVNAAATSGALTIGGLDASAVTYEGGSGVDTVTLTSATVSKAISLGAGNDVLTLASGTPAITAVVDGGLGSDTITMVAADAVTASGSATFAGKVTGFEVLALTGGTGAQLVHLDVLGNYNSVSTGAEPNAGVLTLDGFTSGGTLTLTSSAVGSGAYVVSSAAFTTPTTDTFNIALTKAGTLAGGSVTAAKVESINIATSDTTKSVVAGTNTDTMTLVAVDATKVTVTGNANLNLTGDATNAVLATVDASGATGGLLYTAIGTLAQTVKGGAAANTLAAHTSSTLADTLIGGAGNDSITSNAGLDTLTGGAGADTFYINVASANVNSYATITDAAVSDKIVLSGATSFVAAKLALGGTAVFQDYANLAVSSALAAHQDSWFQYGGDTYIIENVAAAHASFVNGTDLVVKLTGLVDLSHASFSTTNGAIQVN